MKQIQVSRNNKTRITWTDEDTKIKIGNSIRFKNEDCFWNIDKVYETVLEKGEINRSWHVGGL